MAKQDPVTSENVDIDAYVRNLIEAERRMNRLLGWVKDKTPGLRSDVLIQELEEIRWRVFTWERKRKFPEFPVCHGDPLRSVGKRKRVVPEFPLTRRVVKEQASDVQTFPGSRER